MANQKSIDPEIAQFITEDQDPDQVAKAYRKVQQILTSGEKVLYIAIQKPLTVDLAPDVVILTNRRFIDYRPNMLGRATFKDYIWRDLREAVLTEHVMRATLTMHARDGEELRIENLVKSQARRLYAIAQEMEENVREELRLRQMEEKRAEAGGIVLQHTGAQSGSTAAPPEEPLQALGKLKQLMDAGLITSAEYETKKAEILSRL
jgi:hypothetical protein